MDLNPTLGKTEDGDHRLKVQNVADLFRPLIKRMTWPHLIGSPVDAAEDQSTTAAAAGFIKTRRED